MLNFWNWLADVDERRCSMAWLYGYDCLNMAAKGELLDAILDYIGGGGEDEPELETDARFIWANVKETIDATLDGIETEKEKAKEWKDKCFELMRMLHEPENNSGEGME